MYFNMKTYAMALDLLEDSDSIEQYKTFHLEVWPEVIGGLKGIGIEEMRIFLSGTRLFMVLDVPDDFDLENDFQAYTDSSPKAANWDELMRTYQKKVPEAADNEWWSPMEEVFNLNW